MFFVPVTRESRHLSRLLDATMTRHFAPAATGDAAAPRSPALDLVESDAAYTVRLEVPGVAKEDVQVSVEGRRVSVQAGRDAGSDKPEAERVVYRELAGARYARSFALPAEVESAETVAKLENGVLTLTLPKRSARSAARITIN